MLKSPTFIEQAVDNVLDETEDKMDFPLIRQFIAFKRSNGSLPKFTKIHFKFCTRGGGQFHKQ